jgi:hypothetical protein
MDKGSQETIEICPASCYSKLSRKDADIFQGIKVGHLGLIWALKV